MKIVFATNNAHKLEEARSLAGGRITVLSLSDISCREELPETCDTIEGNSLQKASYVAAKYGYPCFSDDTGLFVDALGGAPGVYSARYAGEHCSPADNIVKLLGEMEGKADRKARFRTVATLCAPGREPLAFEGTVEGTIATERHGSGGFGYDPVFIPDESGISFAEMEPEAKNAISHRGRALRQLFDYLQTL
ncbi:MAG: RdgB/HAM1 family non-canonical purine NTP pyrophosphatase [Muribaculaceae bacterium]|nr:RdgB/HAM1 family non-canonical purine NTP pyrophosphatase [Muribaculaceae bacterium]